MIATHPSSPSATTHRSDIAIIGGGIAGLITGALLAREGRKVNIIEKNNTFGGGLQCFSRGGILFSAGMHVLGGFNPGGSLRRICDYLGITQQMHVKPLDPDGFDTITIIDTNQHYRLPVGRERFTNYFCQHFPSEAVGIRAFIDELYRLSQEVDLFYLRPSTTLGFNHSPHFMMPINKVVAEYVADPDLQRLLLYNNSLYAGVENHTPAYIHALISMLYIEAPGQFEGSSQHFANLLAEVVRKAGGDVFTNQTAAHINIDEQEHTVRSVLTREGHCFEADTFVSAIHPSLMLNLTDSHAFTPIFRRRIATAPQTDGGFAVYLKLKPNTFPYANSANYCIYRLDDIWRTSPQERWPDGLMWITPPEENQGTWASNMIVNCTMPTQWVEPWKDSTLGHRPEAYKAWKAERTQRVMDMMERVQPGFANCVEAIYSSSPLTIRDYFGNPHGALYGNMRDSENTLFSHLPIRTKLSNFYLTGQNINLHGLCGVMMTSIETAEAIAGAGSVLNQL